MTVFKWIFGGSYRFYRDISSEYESIMDYMLYKDIITIEDVNQMNSKICEFAHRFRERLDEVPKMFWRAPYGTYYEAMTSLKKAYNRYLDMV